MIVFPNIVTLSLIVIPLPEEILPVVIIPFCVKLIKLFAKINDVTAIFVVVILLHTTLLAMIFPPVMEPDIMLPVIIFPLVIVLETKYWTLMFVAVILSETVLPTNKFPEVNDIVVMVLPLNIVLSI